MEATTISVHDRLGVSDIPDTVPQEANVAASTNLSRAELLERAASSKPVLRVSLGPFVTRRYKLVLCRIGFKLDSAGESLKQ